MPLVLKHLMVETNHTTSETERYVAALTLAHLNTPESEISDCAHRIAQQLVAQNPKLDFLECFVQVESMLIGLKFEGCRAFAAIAKA